MFFTKIAYFLAWILFVVGVLSVVSPLLMKSPPAGISEFDFLAIGMSMVSTGFVMIAMSIGIGVLTEISNNIAKR